MPHETRLRKVGGSVMLAIPPALLDALEMTTDSPVELSIKSGKLLVEMQRGPRYSLDELLAQCDAKKRSAEERGWIDAPTVGREII
ncbi:MAG: AbrB/MazE/SpoVT family DNA-binding domain-containing protein [Alphaproteobacteria bacterium]